jgi:Domain of unknown function (DUF1906)
MTPEGLWWGVDSTTPMSESVLANVRSWYRGGHTPAVWGRYVSGSFAMHPDEFSFARKHGIYLYVLVPDANCSECSGGQDVCGNDRTAAQATQDARDAIRAARKLHIPANAMLFKDVEQVGTCTGELTAQYLLTWYRVGRASPYRVGFYGNAHSQHYDFVTAYCGVVPRHRDFTRDVVLADDEPEPAIGAPAGRIGAANAPRFHPDVPHCAPRKATKIWQYGESLTAGNATDVDEIMPDTPGLIAPDGSVTP